MNSTAEQPTPLDELKPLESDATGSSITEEVKEFIQAEEDVTRTVVESLHEQQSKSIRRFSAESERARTLTSDLVAARREEDKAMLASDEAVAHGLTANKESELKSIEKLLKKPYFGRVVLEEHGSEIEYKIGFAANPDCRIIDWRRAPIAKLYYEYKEGDEYSETILGRERTGRIQLRNTVEIEHEELQKLNCRHGNFVRRSGEWVKVGGAGRSRDGGTTPGALPHILSLITPDQFRTITEDADTAILIQGIAGSGKTTVALHRLGWLLHPENSDLKASECVVIVLSKVLKAYISTTLPSAGIHGVRVATYYEWTADTIGRVAPHLIGEDRQVQRPQNRPGHAIERLKKSFAWLAALEAYQGNAATSPEQSMIDLLSYPERILANDETKLIDSNLIAQAKARAEENYAAQVLDYCDDASLVRLCELNCKAIYFPSGTLGKYRHIVVDEIQDFGALELASVVAAVNDTRNLTLVGDTAQKLDASGTFPGWDKLRTRWAFKDSVSRFISLTVSYRSTLPIMKLADYIQKRSTVKEGRHGRVPIWFKCRTERRGVRAAIDWVQKALELYPNSLTAVICRDRQEAKYALSLLQPTYSSAVRLGDEHSFSFDAGIVVTDVKQTKGLEFTNVLLWNPSAKNYPRDTQGQNGLYIAITRAEENLCMVSWGRPSDYLPSVYSPLVRGMELEPEEES